MHSDSVTQGLDDDDKSGAPNTRPSFLETGHKTIRIKVPLTQCAVLRIYLTQVGADNPDLHYREAVDGEVHNMTPDGMYVYNGIPPTQTVVLSKEAAVNLAGLNTGKGPASWHGPADLQHWAAIELFRLVVDSAFPRLLSRCDTMWDTKNTIFLLNDLTKPPLREVEALWKKYITEDEFPALPRTIKATQSPDMDDELVLSVAHPDC